MYIVTEGHAKIEFVICGMKTITKSLEVNEKPCSLNKEAGAGFLLAVPSSNWTCFLPSDKLVHN